MKKFLLYFYLTLMLGVSPVLVLLGFYLFFSGLTQNAFVSVIGVLVFLASTKAVSVQHNKIYGVKQVQQASSTDS